MLATYHHRLPERPANFTASELLHGDVDGFIINAYLAMQRQWPDEGGFLHYHYVLVQNPGARAEVLRELAASQTSRHLGSMLVDDLAPEFVYAPSPDTRAQDHATFERVSLRLRQLQLIYESRNTRETIARITVEGISGAVQTIVDAAHGSMGHLESRLAALEASVQALRQARFDAAAAELEPSAAPPGSELAWLRHEVLRLSQRVQALEVRRPPAEIQGVAEEDLARLESQLAHLKDVVFPLHQFASVDLKRQFADFVNALVLAHADTVAQEWSNISTATPMRIDDGR